MAVMNSERIAEHNDLRKRHPSVYNILEGHLLDTVNDLRIHLDEADIVVAMIKEEAEKKNARSFLYGVSFGLAVSLIAAGFLIWAIQ